MPSLPDSLSPTLHRYKYQELRLQAGGSPRRRSPWRALWASFAVVFVVGVIFVCYSTYEAPATEIRLISRWKEKKNPSEKNDDADDNKNDDKNDDKNSVNSKKITAANVDSSAAVLQRLPLSRWAWVFKALF